MATPEEEVYDPTLAELGEDGILAEIFPLLRSREDLLVGPGDDAAVFGEGRVNANRTVITTDILVEGVDFRLDWSSPRDVGWKAAAQNLADIAAMGAVPTVLVAALVVPKESRLSVPLGITRGILAACEILGGTLIGGDLSEGSVLTVSITALGDLRIQQYPVLRSGAAPGDVIAVRGRSGWSAAGLALLRHGGANHPDADFALALHRRPSPSVRSGAIAAGMGAHAMIDTSDGLLRDLGRIGKASGMVLDVTTTQGSVAEQIASLEGLAQALGNRGLAREWVLTGGEDHCLAATFDPGRRLPDGFKEVGVVREPGPGETPGVRVDGQPASSLGFDHFKV